MADLSRRLFLGGMLAAGASAPAIVRSGILMPVRPAILLPPDITMEIGRFEDIRLIKCPPLDPLGQRGWIPNPCWRVGQPILNEHCMR